MHQILGRHHPSDAPDAVQVAAHTAAAAAAERREKDGGRKSLPAGVTLPLPGESDDEDVDMEEGGDSPLGSAFGGSPMAARPMSLPPPSPVTFASLRLLRHSISPARAAALAVAADAPSQPRPASRVPLASVAPPARLAVGAFGEVGLRLTSDAGVVVRSASRRTRDGLSATCCCAPRPRPRPRPLASGRRRLPTARRRGSGAEGRAAMLGLSTDSAVEAAQLRRHLARRAREARARLDKLPKYEVQLDAVPLQCRSSVGGNEA